MNSKGLKKTILGIPVFIVLTALALTVVVPLLWLILSAFKEEKEILAYPPTFIPHNLTFANFAATAKRIKIITYIKNSVIYAGVTTALAVVVNSMAGYAYARKKFFGKGAFFPYYTCNYDGSVSGNNGSVVFGSV